MASRRLEANFYGLALALASGPMALAPVALASGPMALALASGPMALALAPVALALASKVQALALRAALTIFCHQHQTHGPTTTTKIKLKVCKIIN